MQVLRIGKYIISKPILEILYDLQNILANGKLRDIRPDAENIVVTCPNSAHSDGREANPDCNIYVGPEGKTAYGFARCFACDFKGTFDRFVAACFDSTLEYAQQWLIKNYGELSAENIFMAEPISLVKNSQKKVLSADCLSQYQDWCPYFEKRGISRGICKEFNLKYDPVQRQVIFPIYDLKDDLVMLARRSIDTKFFHMDKNTEKPVYCLNYIIKNKYNKVLIVEGLFDCMTAYEFGFPAIATLGAISDKQIAAINKSGINTLYLCMDNDTAGKKFTAYLKEHLDPRILLIDIKLPQGKKDINELTREEFIGCVQKTKNTL